MLKYLKEEIAGKQAVLRCAINMVTLVILDNAARHVNRTSYVPLAERLLWKLRRLGKNRGGCLAGQRDGQGTPELVEISLFANASRLARWHVIALEPSVRRRVIDAIAEQMRPGTQHDVACAIARM